jgi:DNA-binding NtrC family response regulator
MRVLIIDDEPAVRSIIRRFLNSLGCHVHEAEDAEAGFRVLHSEEFQLALIDANLPGLSGSAAARMIADAFPRLHLILMSGEDHAGEASAAGAHGFLGKPFEFGELTSLVQRAARVA